MLGLFLLSLTLLSLERPRPVLAAIPFVLSLCFKQMGLYYAPAIFIYLLSLCIPRITRPNIPFVISLGIVVLGTFVTIFLPFLLPHGGINYISAGKYSASTDVDIWSLKSWDIETPIQIFRRVFPFGRGLWEDKVANTWCATNLVIKWRQLYSTPFLQKFRSPSPHPPFV
jgi:alpha-1,3-glucosyltransferase